MKHKAIKLIITIALLGPLIVQADPFKIWPWIDPDKYTNQQPIPAGDLATRTLKCGTVSGGPYPTTVIFTSQISPSNEDMAFAVNGIPGTYYCITTVWSLQYMSQSGYSNEQVFIVAPTEVGFVPMPLVLNPPIDP
jgi:hypothetical protein